MKTLTKIRTGILSLVAGLLVSGTAATAHAECGPFPQGPYIGSFTHAQVQTYVDKSHGGDWTPYLVALQNNLQRLENLRDTSRSAVLKIKGQPTELNAAALSRFVFESQQWLGVAQCLAEQQNLKVLADFSTAAGGDTQPQQEVAALNNEERDATHRPVARRDQVAGVRQPLNVNIAANCSNGDTNFVLINMGETWPSKGVVSVFRIDGDDRQMILARRHILDAGQTKVFKVAKSKNLTGKLGIAIEPSWYSRPFVIDAYASCK